MERYRASPVYRYLLFLSLTAAFGLQGWRTLFNNYAADTVGLNGFQVGLIQSVREIPGFLTFLVALVAFYVRETRLGALSLVLLGAGVGAAGFFPSFTGLIVTTFVMSLGFHYFETINQALCIQCFSRAQTPHVMGRLKALVGLANIGAGAVVLGVSLVLPFSVSFVLIGAAVAAAGVRAWFREPAEHGGVPQLRRLLFRRRYLLYYVLSFLAGARRQIFVCFAVFLLVKRHGFQVEWVAGLFIVNNVLTYLVLPRISRGIARFGERAMLTLEYSSLTLIFLGYALLDNPWAAAVLYLLDHVFFGFTIGINTYLQKVADPAEVTPSVSTGFAVNHISAVIVPAFGGALWMLNWRIPFLMGAALAVCSLAAVQWIRVGRADDGPQASSSRSRSAKG
ncbi:MAG TPA: MFS transporter [bacterium]|nr:MFS transporter [bacterium]HPJ71917.1 MFS transporter [bacterium]HPQ66258.1 MFS transporter [bacterium]